MKKLILLIMLICLSACSNKVHQSQDGRPLETADNSIALYQEESSATQQASQEPNQLLRQIDMTSFDRPEDIKYYPTTEDFSSYLQDNIDFYKAKTDGALELWLWERGDNPDGIKRTHLLAYPVLVSDSNDWVYYGVDTYRGEIYRWGKNIEKEPEQVIAQEIFPTALSALEYVKSRFVDTVNYSVPFEYELLYEQNGTPYYCSQTILQNEREYTNIIEITDQYDDRYKFHIYVAVIDSPPEGHTVTAYWLTVYKGGFIYDEIIPNLWIASGSD